MLVKEETQRQKKEECNATMIVVTDYRSVPVLSDLGDSTRSDPNRLPDVQVFPHQGVRTMNCQLESGYCFFPEALFIHALYCVTASHLKRKQTHFLKKTSDLWVKDQFPPFAWQSSS